ncbi:MAG TPA: endonuclease III [Isosphaeraceae bacterium]|nr:endonuclease III [Isosphaeraceae bacterium]
MPTLHESYPGMVVALADRYGRLDPFPEDPDPFARILRQAVDPRKASTILNALREAGLLDAATLAEAEPTEIAEAAQESGASLTPAAVRPLQRLARWLVERHQGSADALAEEPTARLRDELLSLNGIGPASADAILLFALHRPVYPVDRASYRVLVRHGWLEPTADYDEARDTLERLAPEDPDALAHLSAWLDRIGHDVCRASVAKCDRCPLKPFLPPTGPVAPEP